MVFDVTYDLPPVQGDKVEIEQVIVNLARNGLEAMDKLPAEDRVLQLGACRGQDDTVEIFVRDCGIGVASEAQDKNL